MGQPECIIAVQKMLDLYTLYTTEVGMRAWATACKAYGLNREDATSGYRVLHGVLSRTEPFYLTAEVTKAISEDLPPTVLDVRLEREDLPASAGYLHLNRPVVLTGSEERYGIAALSWAVNDWFATPSGEGLDSGFVLVPWIVDMEADPDGPDLYLPAPLLHAPFRSGSEDDRPSAMCDMDVCDPVTLELSSLGMALFTEAVLYMEQRLLITGRPANVGSLARRKYHSVWKHEPTVKVITLRAVDYVQHAERGSAEVDWRYRWRVRPHTRTLRDGRRITVKGYEKLRDRTDLPLKEYQATVFDVSR